MARLVIILVGIFGVLNGPIMVVSPGTWLALPEWFAPKGGLARLEENGLPRALARALVRAAGMIFILVGGYSIWRAVCG